MYGVTQDYLVAEFDIALMAGEVVYDGQLEPDLTAQLVASGVLAPVYGDGPTDGGNDLQAEESEGE